MPSPHFLANTVSRKDRSQEQTGKCIRDARLSPGWDHDLSALISTLGCSLLWLWGGSHMLIQALGLPVLSSQTSFGLDSLLLPVLSSSCPHSWPGKLSCAPLQAPRTTHTHRRPGWHRRVPWGSLWSMRVKSLPLPSSLILNSTEKAAVFKFLKHLYNYCPQSLHHLWTECRVCS